jgi:hypothetical protein
VPPEVAEDGSRIPVERIAPTATAGGADADDLAGLDRFVVGQSVDDPLVRTARGR